MAGWACQLITDEKGVAMATLREALRASGLISGKEEKEECVEKKEGDLTSCWIKMSEELEKCNNIKSFREKAREILLQDHERIGLVLQSAYQVLGESLERKVLINCLKQLRTELKKPSVDHQEIIKKLLK